MRAIRTGMAIQRGTGIIGSLVFGWLEKPEGGKNDYSDIVKMGLALLYRTKPMILRAYGAVLKAKGIDTPKPADG